MKIYCNVNYLQKVIKDNCNNDKQFLQLFDANIINEFSTDKDNNLLYKNNNNEDIPINSTLIYLLSDYYKCVGDAIKRIETLTEQQPINNYKQHKDLGILFFEPFISLVNKEFRIQKNMNNGTYIDDNSFQDDVGGIHDEGLGWAPNGNYCGECSNMTCRGCHVLKNLNIV